MNKNIYLNGYIIIYYLDLIIYIYDTSDDFSLKNSLINQDIKVSIIHKPLNHRNFSSVQLINMTDFTKEYSSKYKWCAMIDCDEFIVLKKHSNINEFLQSINLNSGCLGINWKIFGSNSHENYTESFVVNRFTKSSKFLNQHVKCITVFKDVNYYNNPHFPILKNGKQVNEKGIVYTSGPFQTNSTSDLIQINHYVTKSKQEFYDRSKGHHTRTDNDSFFNHHNENDITDLCAYNFLNYPRNHNNINTLDYHYYLTNYEHLLIHELTTKDLAENHFKNDGIKENKISNLNFKTDNVLGNKENDWYEYKMNQYKLKLKRDTFDSNKYKNNNKIKLKIEYGTTNNKIDVSNKFKNINIIPKGDINRYNIIEIDPCQGIVKSIFINGIEYNENKEINLTSLN